MNILVTGDRGYIGSVLVDELLKLNHILTGIDNCYYEENYFLKPKYEYKLIKKDIRDINLNDLRGYNVVIHLAALSNDPLGELSKNITQEINYNSTTNLAKLAKKAGVERFIYTSTQSLYGISNTNDELDEVLSKKNPITEYAKAKWNSEKDLLNFNSSEFNIVILRPSTVFGVSPRLRTDIVFNNLVACAYSLGKIIIKSDGSPWRPIIHIKDLCSAIIACINAPAKLINGKIYNVGIKNGNYRVLDLAQAAKNVVKNCEIFFTNEHTDPRTYKVSFTKINTELTEYFKPEWDLEKGAKELMHFFEKVNFSEKDFAGRKSIRLKQIKYLIDNKIIDDQLRYI